jgi:hypothetical protein
MKVSPRGNFLKILPLLAVSLLFITAADNKPPALPQEVPVPKVHEPPAGNIPPQKLGDTPVPEPRPDKKGDTAEPDADKKTEPVTAPATAPLPTENPELPDEKTPADKGEPEKQEIPATAPVPTENPKELDEASKDQKPLPPTEAPKPDEAKPGEKPTTPEEKAKPGENPPESEEKSEPKYLPDPRSNEPRPATMPAEELACRARIKDLGVEFEEHKPESDPAGCAMPWPITVKSLGKTIELAPDALMNCTLAEASAKFAKDVISPAAKAAYGEELKSISQASAYVCRPRNGTKKLSEHAFGNALDIAQFTLSKDTKIDVEPAPDEKAAKFLAEIRKAACGPFKTVLGPGSDADHSLHFHFDLAPRKHGGTFCQ